MMSNKAAIILTASAVLRIQELLKTQHPSQKFRVYITGGGCSGFQYGFKLDNKQNEDVDIDDNSIVDPKSLQYLLGSTLDYLQSLQGSRFVITNNPNAEGGCGCGASFTLKGQKADCG